MIGDSAERREHKQETRRMHGMEMHDDANGVSLAPGETMSPAIATTAWAAGSV